jgi:hypothetical protein
LKDFSFLEFAPGYLNLGFRNPVIFIGYLTIGFRIQEIFIRYVAKVQKSETNNCRSRLRAWLEFHLNCCFGGLITRFGSTIFHQGISKSQKSDFLKFLLFLSRAFDFFADKSLIHPLAFASVFSPRFAPDSILISSIAPSLSPGAFDFLISVPEAVFRILLTLLILSPTIFQ